MYKLVLSVFILASPALAQVVGGTVVQGNVASGATDAGNPVKVGGVYNSGGVTLTNGQRGDMQLDVNGLLKVNVAAGSTGNSAASATGSAVPANAGYTGINVAGNLRGWTGVNPSGSIYAGQVDLASVAGTTADTNSGNKSAGTLRVVVATDQPNLTSALNVSVSNTPSVAQSGNWSVRLQDGSGTTINSTSNALNVSVQNASLATTQSGTWTMVPKTACGTTATDSGFIANVATTGTDIFSASTCVSNLLVCNSTTSNSTVQIKDKTGTPNVYSGNIPVLASSCLNLPLNYLKFNLGLTLFAGNASTIQAQGFGWQ